MKKIEPCAVCGQHFDNVFELVDHLEDDDGLGEFDPYYVLPNGYKLMLGSLLRTLFESADDKERIQYVVQDTYMLLYASETEPENIKQLVEDTIVEEHMENFDKEYEKLFGKGDDGGKGIRK